MAFDISKLTSAVNKYLNSISEVSNAAKRANEEIASKTRFSTELGDAIRQNIESRMRDQAQVPDIADQIQTQIKQATSGIDVTIEQINGGFEAIREAGKVSGASAAARTGAEDRTGASAGDTKTGIKTGAEAGMTAVTAVGRSGSSGAATTSSTTNRDAYLGNLSTEALQELSRSRYFSANLIQSSLFDAFNENGEKSSGSNSGTSTGAASAFDSLSLSELNTNSLLKSAGLNTDSTQTIDALSSGNLSQALRGLVSTNTSTAGTRISNATDASTTSATDASDLAKALIKAYTNSGASAATTSIFGDFTL
jgi:hypothetical protein